MPLENDRDALLRAPRTLQRAAGAGDGGRGRGGRALLLPQPHRLQRPLPVQQIGRVQRAVRAIQPDQLQARLRALSRARLRPGRSRTATSSRCRSTPDDFVYADPPYDVQFTQYSRGGFGWDDQVRVAKWLSTHPGPVVLSNQATPRIVKLYRSLGFSLKFKNAPRRIELYGRTTSCAGSLAVQNLEVEGWGS